MDKDTFSADDFVREAMNYLKDVLALGMENGIAEIRPCKDRDLLADRTYCREIQAGLTFTPKVEGLKQRKNLKSIYCNTHTLFLKDSF